MPQITTAFAPDFVTTMRWALDAASDRVPVTSRTPATKAKMAQRIVRSAHEGITDAHQLVAAAVPKAWCPRSRTPGPSRVQQGSTGSRRGLISALSGPGVEWRCWRIGVLGVHRCPGVEQRAD